MRLTILGVLTTLTALVTTTLAPTADAAPPRVVSRVVTFDVENTNATSALCLPDNQSYQLRGRLVGPRRAVETRSGPLRINVLVHDEGTGGWFWHLRGLRARPAGYDYATRLARRGETSLVLDRLGYGASGQDAATCLGAQADMLHQVVQHLRSGRYDFADKRFGSTPAAAHVVTHGHGVGAAIAQVEAATFDDVAGLVLMSWTDKPVTPLAQDALGQQATSCVTGGATAPAVDATAFRLQLFAAAPERVQRRATALRAPVPCGDVLSRAPMVLASGLGAGQIDVPVLLLYGSKDALTRPAARTAQASAYPTKVTSRTFQGAGSALPLERPTRVGATVLSWLDRL